MIRSLVTVCIFGLGMVLALPVFAQSVDLRDPGEHFFQETFGDLQEELQIASEEGKQGLFVFFELDECPFCDRMKSVVLNRSDVQDYYREHFRIITIDIEGDIEMVDFEGRETTQKELAFSQFKVRATPVFCAFDLTGKEVARHTGPTRGAEEFLWFGEYVTDKIYKQQSFTRYKRARRKQAGSG